MAAANPIIEQIILDVVGTIDGITTDNGYQQDLNAVRPTRMDLDDEGPGTDGDVVVTFSDPDPADEHSAAGNPPRQGWTVQLTLIAYVIPSDASTAPLDTLINRVRADIEKALQVDHTRGGLAINTTPAGSQKFAVEGGSTTGVAVFADVTYRTPLNNPYTQA